MTTILAVCAALGSATGLVAQTTNGSIAGKVTDTSGAVIAGASVTVTNNVTGQVRTAVTSSDGSYSVPQLPPGKYDVQVTGSGFSTKTTAGLILDVNQADQENFVLGVSGVTANVTVNAEAPLLDATNGHISQVIDADTIVDLPLNGRQFTQLTLLTPGASPRGSNQQGAFLIGIGDGSISPAINGQRSQQNNFTMDGVENNSLFLSTYAISPPPDALHEFAVTSHITDAQFAISSGANINVVTKSGTKQYHGAVWEFIRNNSLDAKQDTPNRDAFSQVASQPYHLNQYGLQFDGPFPLLKNKMWFSGYWEGVRIAQTTSGITNVPTAAERRGDFSDILGTAIGSLDANGHPTYNNEIFDPFTQVFTAGGSILRQPLGGYDSTGRPRNSFAGVYPVNKASQAIIDRYLPAPNIAGADSLSGNYRYPNINTTKVDQYGIRIDHRLRNNDLIFGRYNRANANRTVAQSIDTLTNVSQNYARQLALGYTHLFSPNIVLDVRYANAKTTVQVDDTPAGQSLITAVNWQDVQPIKNGTPLGPQTYLRGGPFLQQQALPLGPQTTNQGNVDISVTRGKHTIGAGAFLYHLHSFADGWHVGAYFFGTSTSSDGGWGPTGNGFAGFELGSIDRFEGSVGDTSADVTTLWRAGYVQDQWKVTNRLTVTGGLRYDYVPPPTYTAVTTTLDPSNGQFLISRPEPQSGYPNRIGPVNTFYPQYNGWQPRFGFALAATDKTVVRGAFAILDDHNNVLVQQGQDIRQSFPRAASYFVENVWSDSSKNLRPTTHSADVNHTQFVFGQNETAAAQLLTSSTPTIGFAVDPHAKIPYSLEYNLGVEQELTRKISLAVDYVGSASRHLFVQGPYNGPRRPGTAASSSRGIPFPAFGQYQQDLNAGTGAYNALQVKVKQANYHGLSFLASYTWSKSQDNQSEGQSGTLTNVYDLRRDFGPSDFDYRHLFALSGTYQLPFGRGREFLGNAGRAQDLLVGGWNFGSIFYARSGAVGQLQCGDTGNLGAQWGRCDVVPGVPRYIGTGSRGAFLNPKAYAQPAPGTLGNESRNDWHNPPSWDEDVSLFKDFHIVERATFQFRVEAFNVFNTPNVSVGGNYQYNNLSTLGRLQSAGSPRRLQFAGKIFF